MITGSYVKGGLGIQTIDIITDDNGNKHYNVRIEILRQVTKEDYLKYAVENFNIPIPPESVLNRSYFYEISID